MKPLAYSIIAILVIVISLMVYFIYLFNKAPENLIDLEPDITISASDLFGEFENDEIAANTKYIEKVILVEGRLSEVIEHEDGSISMLLENENDFGGINCSFGIEESKAATDINIGDLVNIKGYCTGMLMDVALNKCVLVTNE